MGFFDFIYPNGQSPEITAVRAHAEQENGALLIDIRPIFQWNAGRARGAIHIPEERLSRSKEIRESERVILMCSDGTRSLVAARRLRNSGINATNVHGGLTAWKASGFEVVR